MKTTELINKKLTTPIDKNLEVLNLDRLIDKDNTFVKIFSKVSDDQKQLIDFKTFNQEKLDLIANRMPEINRATNAFGKRNSQMTGKLMTLNMISQSPYRYLKQCLAQIEKKRNALKENIFKLRTEKVKLEKLLFKKECIQKEIETKTGNDEINLKFDLEEVNIEVESMACGISDSTIYIEGCLKEIGMYQDAYEEIKESHKIPDDWDEEDFEKTEVEEHIKTAFLHLIRDVEMTGRINVGTSEYLEQYGVNPHVAFILVKKYIENVQALINDDKLPSIEILYNFLDSMYETFKNEYKHPMKRIGLKKLISEDFIYLSDK